MERWTQIREPPIVKHPKFYLANPSLAHKVFLSAIREHGNGHSGVHEFARKGLEAVWANEGNIADGNTIVKLATESGLNGAKFMDQGGFGLRIFQWQDVTVARVLAGRSALPSVDEMKWKDDQLAATEDGPGS